VWVAWLDVGRFLRQRFGDGEIGEGGVMWRRLVSCLRRRWELGLRREIGVHGEGVACQELERRSYLEWRE
jgi:hypothetical protein